MLEPIVNPTKLKTTSVIEAFVVGSISADQTICPDSIPALITGIPPTGGQIPYTFQWESSADGLSFSDIPFALELDYQPGALSTTTYFRLKQSSYQNCLVMSCGTQVTNIVAIQVSPALVPGMIGADQSIAFNTIPEPLTGTPPFGGTPPYSYQWQSSSNGVIFFSIPGATDLNYAPDELAETTFYRQIQSSANHCGSFPTNIVEIRVGIPVDVTVKNDTIRDGQVNCYDATQTITVAGNGTTCAIYSGGSATFIAGQNIRYLPGTMVQPGGYMHGYITLTGEYCGAKAPAIVEAGMQSTKYEVRSTKYSDNDLYRVYPNPTDGKFMVEYIGKDQPGTIQVEVFSMKGERILTKEMTEVRKQEFSLEGRAEGIYLVRIIADKGMKTVRVMKR